MPVLNPNWPVMDFAVCWAAGRGASPVQDYWCSVAERTEGSATVRRGKQYELDQVQPGEATLTLRNDDGAFDPSNGSSPYAGYVVPYRLMRIRAQWSPTVNLLTAAQASANKAVGLTVPSQWVYALGGISLSVQALDATVNKYFLNYGAAPALGQGIAFTGFAVAPGVTYSGSANLQGSSATGLTLVAQLVWYNAAGSIISTSAGSTFTIGTGTAQISVSGTAPANAAGAKLQIVNTNSPGTFTFVYVSRVQLEKAAAPTTWALPGTWYSLFTGFIERWPQKWQSGGNYGLSDLTAVDLFAWWASQGLNYCAWLDLLALGPTWFYPLADPQGVATFSDVSGANRAAATITPLAGLPSQTIAVGASLTGNPGTAPPLGIPSTVAGVVNTTSEIGAQLIDLTASGAAPAGPQSSVWTRVIGFQLQVDKTLASTTAGVLYMQGPAGSSARIYGSVNYDASGNPGSFNINIYNRAGTLVGQVQPVPAALRMSDGGWHLLTISCDATTVSASLDGAAASFASAGSMPTTADFAGGVDVLGGTLDSGTRVAGNGATGQFAFVAELPFRISAAQYAALWRSFKYAWSGSDTSDGRYQRIVGWAGYTGPTAVDAGASVTYGAAVDLVGGSSPTSVLAALQAVVTTEVGQHFVSAAGVVTFRSRRARMNAAALVTFGEQAGEVPYLDAATDFDPTRLANEVSATPTYGPMPAAVANDPVSQSNYGIVTLQRTLNTTSATDLLGGAQYVLYQNATPSQRLESLPVDVASNPSVWPSLLARDLGDCVLVNRRPSNAPAIAIQGFVEQIAWELGDDGSAKWTGQVSSNAQHQFLQLDSATFGLLDSFPLGY